MARLKAAREAKAAKLAKAEREPHFPERYAQAQASRPKVIDLSNGQIKAEHVSEKPEALLERALA